MRLAMPLGLETMGFMMLWDHEPVIQPLPRNGGLGFQNRVRVELCTSTLGPGYIALGGAEVKARASRAHGGSVRIFGPSDALTGTVVSYVPTCTKTESFIPLGTCSFSRSFSKGHF